MVGPLGFNVSTAAFFKTPRSFSIDKPELDGDHAEFIERKNLKFDWSDASGDWMFGIFSLACQDESDTWVALQRMTCASPDPTGTGSFDLDGNQFTDWDEDCLLYVYMSSVNYQPDEGFLVLPQNRAELRMHAVHTMFGAIYTD